MNKIKEKIFYDFKDIPLINVNCELVLLDPINDRKPNKIRKKDTIESKVAKTLRKVLKKIFIN